MTKRISPNTNPCRTPLMTGVELDKILYSDTC